MSRRFYMRCASLGLCLFVLPAVALAQGGAVDERLSKLEQATVQAQSAGDNAWMLVCAALVLLMTGPGLALFYGGLVAQEEGRAAFIRGRRMMVSGNGLVWVLGCRLARS